MPAELDVNSPTNVTNRPRRRTRKRCVRRAMLSLYESGKFAYRFTLQRDVDKFLSTLEIATILYSRRKNKPHVDVDDMVARWKEAVVNITLAHDKKQVDEWEAKLSDLLEPFLKCPVKQIREFCAKLTTALESDPKIPFFLARGVGAYCKIIVGSATNQGVMELKKDIAMRIAKGVEGDVQPQLVEAITNALMWRDPATLRRVEKAVKRGAPAKLVGRESCLFLEVDGETVML